MGVSKAAKASTASKLDEMPFEDALKKLETIVETMESGELPLETLLARFEEGTRLARFCEARLADAELKIQRLETTTGGEMTLTPLSADISAEAED